MCVCSIFKYVWMAASLGFFRNAVFARHILFSVRCNWMVKQQNRTAQNKTQNMSTFNKITHRIGKIGKAEMSQRLWKICVWESVNRNRTNEVTKKRWQQFAYAYFSLIHRFYLSRQFWTLMILYLNGGFKWYILMLMMAKRAQYVHICINEIYQRTHTHARTHTVWNQMWTKKLMNGNGVEKAKEQNKAHIRFYEKFISMTQFICSCIFVIFVDCMRQVLLGNVIKFYREKKCKWNYGKMHTKCGPKIREKQWNSLQWRKCGI